MKKLLRGNLLSLEQYAATVPGHQDYKGAVNAEVEVSGLGQDLKTVHGRGEAHVAHADFGKIPIYLELTKPLKLNRKGRSGFVVRQQLINPNLSASRD